MYEWTRAFVPEGVSTQTAPVEFAAVVPPAHVLLNHRDQLELVTSDLLRCETLDGQNFNRLIGRSPKADQDKPGTPVEIAPPSLASTRARRDGAGRA